MKKYPRKYVHGVEGQKLVMAWFRKRFAGVSVDQGVGELMVAHKYAATHAVRTRGSSKGYLKSVITCAGYLMVNFWVHRLVAALALGRPLLEGEQVHHVNGDSWDNRVANLVVVGSQREHKVEEGSMGWSKPVRKGPVVRVAGAGRRVSQLHRAMMEVRLGRKLEKWEVVYNAGFPALPVMRNLVVVAARDNFRFRQEWRRNGVDVAVEKYGREVLG